MSVYVNYSNKAPALPISTASVIGGYVALGQALAGGVTERLILVNTLDDYYDQCGVTALDMTKELDKFLDLAFNVYGIAPVIIYNVDSTSTSAADIVAGIVAVQNEAEAKLKKTCFVLGAEDSGTETTIRSALDTFTRAGQKARMFYQIDNTETTTAGCIADKTITTKEALATIGKWNIGGTYDYFADMPAICTLVKNSTTIERKGRVFRSVSKIKVPNAVSYSHSWTEAEVLTLEQNGIMSMLPKSGMMFLKGVYTAHYTATGSPDITQDYQCTVDTLAQMENEITNYILLRIIDEPMSQDLIDSVISTMNANLSGNAGLNSGRITAIKNNGSNLTVYMTTSPKVPITMAEVENTVVETEFDITL